MQHDREITRVLGGCAFVQCTLSMVESSRCLGDDHEEQLKCLSFGETTCEPGAVALAFAAHSPLWEGTQGSRGKQHGSALTCLLRRKRESDHITSSIHSSPKSALVIKQNSQAYSSFNKSTLAIRQTLYPSQQRHGFLDMAPSRLHDKIRSMLKLKKRLENKQLYRALKQAWRTPDRSSGRLANGAITIGVESAPLEQTESSNPALVRHAGSVGRLVNDGKLDQWAIREPIQYAMNLSQLLCEFHDSIKVCP